MYIYYFLFEQQTAAAGEIPEVGDEEFEMDFQSKIDYAGPGANNHHTPRPPATSEGGKS